MKRTLFIIVFCVCIPAFVLAQDATIQSNIRMSLSKFFEEIDAVNVPEEHVKGADIAFQFLGGNYFKFNNIDYHPVSFIETYCKNYLNSRIINHTIENLKFKSEGYGCFKVVGNLKRSAGDENDYIIKDSSVEFLIRYNSDGENVTILSMNFSPNLDIIYPKWSDEYVFKTEGLTNFSHTEGSQTLFVDSKVRRVKSYDGEVAERGEYVPVEYRFEGSRGLKIKQLDNNKLEISVNSNKYRRDLEYQLAISQVRSKENIVKKTINIRQSGKPSFFDFDDRWAPKYQLEVIYSLKYDLGLNFMFTIPYSRFAIGGVVATNFNSYRGLFQRFENDSSNGSSEKSSYITNGYRKTIETYTGTSANSNLVDPYNEVEDFVSRSYFLVQGGVYICQWLRFDLGLGVTRTQDVHYMKNTYDIIKYSYEPMSADLPNIDDIYRYIRTDTDRYYRDANRWDFAIRPALNGQIPIGYSDNFITLSVGYLYTPFIHDFSSFDFSLGYGINF